MEHGSILYQNTLIQFIGYNYTIAQDGYPHQSEGRTPGDEDSGGVDGGHSEIMHCIQQTCMYGGHPLIILETDQRNICRLFLNLVQALWLVHLMQN